MSVSRGSCVLALLLAFPGTPAFATRYVERTNEESVAESKWVFTGFILRSETFISAIAGGSDVQYFVQVGRVLRGTLPKTVIVRGSAIMPTGAGRTFVFFADPVDPPISGIRGTLQYGAIRPLSEFKEIEKLVAKKPAGK